MTPSAPDPQPTARVQLVVALLAEARPLVEHFGLSAVRDSGAPREFANPEASIGLVVSGIGRANAAAAVARYRHFREAAWLNVGIAGHGQHRVGDPFVADRIVDDTSGRTWHPRLIFPPPCPTASLRTVERACLDFPTDDLYDMEAAGFYETAIGFAKPGLVQSLKVVSDNLDQRASMLTPARVTELIDSNLAPITALVRSFASC